MIKIILILTTLTSVVAFNWDKVPEPVKKMFSVAKTATEDVYENGQDMPRQVKSYVDTILVPKAKKMKQEILD